MIGLRPGLQAFRRIVVPPIPTEPFANWAALPLNAQEGTRALVTSLGTGGSNGVAVLSGGVWQLHSGVFTSLANLQAFAQPIVTGAVCSVESSGSDGPNGIRYRYAGSWVRTSQITLGVVWPLSHLRDFAPTGSVGTLREGDYGFYGARLYRYAAAVPVAAGGTTPMWLPPAVYAGTLSVRGLLVGTETIPSLPGSVGGVAFSRTNTGGTVVQTGDYIEMQVQTSTGVTLLGQCNFTQGNTVKTYTQMEAAWTAAGAAAATATTRWHSSEGNGQPGWYYSAVGAGSAPSFTAANLTLQGSTLAVRQQGIALPTVASGTYDWLEWIDEGANVAVEAIRNGASYARSTRSSSTAGGGTTAAGVSIWMTGGSGGAGSTHTLRFRNWRTLTWT